MFVAVLIVGYLCARPYMPPLPEDEPKPAVTCDGFPACEICHKPKTQPRKRVITTTITEETP
jgi:hypothetical protein